MISGLAGRWTALGQVRLGASDEPGERFGVARSRAYRDRLVLKLEGIDDAASAARLRGRVAWAPAAEVPVLGEGEFYQGRLLGLEVLEEGGARPLGRVEDVIETGAVDVLVVRGDAGEVLIPMAREYLVRVNEADGELTVRLPEGLRDLNRGGV